MQAMYPCNDEVPLTSTQLLDFVEEQIIACEFSKFEERDLNSLNAVPKWQGGDFLDERLRRARAATEMQVDAPESAVPPAQTEELFLIKQLRGFFSDIAKKLAEKEKKLDVLCSKYSKRCITFCVCYL